MLAFQKDPSSFLGNLYTVVVKGAQHTRNMLSRLWVEKAKTELHN
jgi:hypothetical protein